MNLILEKSNLSKITNLTKLDINSIHKAFKEYNVYFDFEANIEELTLDEYRQDEFFIIKFKEFVVLNLDKKIEFFKYIDKRMHIYEYDKNSRFFTYREQEIGITNRYYLQTMQKVNKIFEIYVVSNKNKQKQKQKEFNIADYVNEFCDNVQYQNIIKKVLNNIFKTLKEELNTYNADLKLDDEKDFYNYSEHITQDLKILRDMYSQVDNAMYSSKKKIVYFFTKEYVADKDTDRYKLNTMMLYIVIKNITSKLYYHKYINVYNYLVKDPTLYKEYKNLIDNCKKYKKELDYLSYANNFDII